jgi:hypothetical protein
VERQCFSMTETGSTCERCKHDRQSCSLGKGSKKAKAIKVKKEPGVDEGFLSEAKVGVKRKSAAKADDRGPTRKLKKSRASSFASGGSMEYLGAASLSVSSVPSSFAVSNEDSDMDVVNPHSPVDDADSIQQMLVVLDAVLKNAEGVVKGAKFLKKAIKDLGIAHGDGGTED